MNNLVKEILKVADQFGRTKWASDVIETYETHYRDDDGIVNYDSLKDELIYILEDSLNHVTDINETELIQNLIEGLFDVEG
jgi:uncharacterized protein YprB with RNaseH-like and TPR domain